jgi:hypothetical protein
MQMTAAGSSGARLKAPKLTSGDGASANGRDPPKLMCGRLSKFKDNLITPGEVPAQVEAPEGPPLIYSS